MLGGSALHRAVLVLVRKVGDHEHGAVRKRRSSAPVARAWRGQLVEEDDGARLLQAAPHCHAHRWLAHLLRLLIRLVARHGESFESKAAPVRQSRRGCRPVRIRLSSKLDAARGFLHRLRRRMRARRLGLCAWLLLSLRRRRRSGGGGPTQGTPSGSRPLIQILGARVHQRSRLRPRPLRLEHRDDLGALDARGLCEVVSLLLLDVAKLGAHEIAPPSVQSVVFRLQHLNAVAGVVGVGSLLRRRLPRAAAARPNDGLLVVHGSRRLWTRRS
mmetsp:Transcript_251/g.832  ORF Transcript_251/g.832 Transcript_251/m.832 type:complete len:272 (-) Transcript_251:2331-3146(-)